MREYFLSDEGILNGAGRTHTIEMVVHSSSR